MRLLPPAFLITLSFVIATNAQQNPPSSDSLQTVQTLQISTRLVGVEALVFNSRGVPVGGLAKDDFVLLEDGKPQVIRSDTPDADRPLTLALMVDTSGSQKSYIAQEVAASAVFFRTMLANPQTRATLVQFDTEILHLHEMTHSVDEAQMELIQLFKSRPVPVSHYPIAGTLLYDAVVDVCHNTLTDEKGRRAIVLLTDGGDNGSHSTLQQALLQAQRADTTIYSVFYTRDPSTEEGKSGRKILDKLSDATGGRVFTVDDKHPLDEIFHQIEGEMRLQYQLTYRPPDSVRGSYHRVVLKTKRGSLKVAARTGYYTQ